MMTVKVWGEGYRTSTICVDSYVCGNPVGRLYNPYLNRGKGFQSTVQLLLEMERALDAMNFPGAFTEMRTFLVPPENENCRPESLYRPGEAATFAVKILFRQNASWQGSVVWLEGKQEQSFRSVLELLFLMDSAICASRITEKAHA